MTINSKIPQSDYLLHVATLEIPATNGNRMIYKERSLFSLYRSPTFKKLTLLQYENRAEVIVGLYEQIHNSTFNGLFSFHGYRYDDFCFTQDQIIEFCNVHRKSLSPSGFNFFLFNRLKDGQRELRSVAGVMVGEDAQLGVKFFRFDYIAAFLAKHSSRIFIPVPKD